MDRYISINTRTMNSVSSVSRFEHVVGVAILRVPALLHARALSWRRARRGWKQARKPLAASPRPNRAAWNRVCSPPTDAIPAAEPAARGLFLAFPVCRRLSRVSWALLPFRFSGTLS